MELDNVNFSEVMEYVVNKYNSRCYIDNIDIYLRHFLYATFMWTLFYRLFKILIEK